MMEVPKDRSADENSSSQNDLTASHPKEDDKVNKARNFFVAVDYREKGI
jgi:hypothetical protein